MTILETAQEAIYGARNASYGHPRDNFTHTARLWSAHKGVEFTAQEVAEFMVLLKLSRLQNGYHEDSVVDIAGYAGTIARLQEPVEVQVGATPDSTWFVDGVQHWAVFNDIPLGTQVNSSDEPDGYVPWSRTEEYVWEEGDFGVGPWRVHVPGEQHEVRTPRVWATLRSVPVGVTVSDEDGDLWDRVRGGAYLYSDDGDGYSRGSYMTPASDLPEQNIYGPFTEQVTV